jgi:hypothetical protein
MPEHYFHRFRKRLFKELGDSVKTQLLVGFILAGLILFWQVRTGLITKGDIGVNIAALLWPYIVVLAGFTVYHLGRTAFLLDRENQNRIAELGNPTQNFDTPQLFLDYSADDAKDFLSKSGLSVRNCGKRSAFIATLSCETAGRVRLLFDQMPIQRIDPDKGVMLKIMTEHLGDDGRWHPIGGTQGGQVEGCFEWLNNLNEEEMIPVTIKYSDYEGRQYTKTWTIRRDGILFLSKHIWCDQLQSAEAVKSLSQSAGHR